MAQSGGFRRGGSGRGGVMEGVGLSVVVSYWGRLLVWAVSSGDGGSSGCGGSGNAGMGWRWWLWQP